MEHDPQKPPEVFFDTNVWIGMNNADMDALARIQAKRGFLYRYSVTNYCEILAHLEDPPSESCQNPFSKYQWCFRKIVQICQPEILPSPEMELLGMAGLDHYLDPVWIPNPSQIALASELVANAANLAELTGESDKQEQIPRYVVKPSHYRKLRDTDEESFIKSMQSLEDIPRPISGSDKKKMDKLVLWFMKLANFFFLIRPSSKKIHYDLLMPEERDRFTRAFTKGAGRLFHAHCVRVAGKTINEGRKIDPNDLYDAMQLLLLRNENCLFVTNDRFFHLYELDPEIQRVLPWDAFRKSVSR